LLNLAFFFTVRELDLRGEMVWSSGLLVVAAVAMPLLCYLSALRRGFRHLFFVPTLSVIIGVALLLWRLLKQ
jgi:hypothetical protein